MKDFYKEEKRGWRREGEGDKRDPFYSSISVEFQIRKKKYILFNVSKTPLLCQVHLQSEIDSCFHAACKGKSWFNMPSRAASLSPAFGLRESGWEGELTGALGLPAGPPV